MKQNKSLIILLLVAVIGIVGVTIAYFSSTTTFENEFQTQDYGTTYIEKFVSPDNWLPGDVTEKTLEVRNSGNVDEAVRVKVEESWVSKNSTTLPLTQGDNVAALINFINDDDWTKLTVDGENYYYYYYNYKLAPEQTTSKLLDKVTFNPLIGASTTCSDTIENRLTTRTCNSDGTGYDGATYTLKFTIETVQYNKYTDAWNTNITIKPTNEIIINGLPANLKSATYENGDKHKMFMFSHAATEQTPALTDYRYIGDDPYNYVYFNCDSLDNQNSETCEIWRILGVFDVEREIDDEENPGQKKTITETRMKLVLQGSLSSGPKGDTRNSEQHSAGNYGKNDWNGSSMNLFLNGAYFNRLESASDSGLKQSARGMIEEAKFYLGGHEGNSSAPKYGTTEDIYVWERGTHVYNGRPIAWQGKVALMYPSDFYSVYGKDVNNACYENPNRCGNNANTGWIFNSKGSISITNQDSTWLLSPCYDDTYSAFYVSGGSYGSLYEMSLMNTFAIRPVVYLSSDVQIFDGDGSEQNPYKLKK